MTAALLGFAAALLATLLAGLLRVWRGPTDADRMLAAQLLGTTAVALLLVLSLVLAAPRLVDLALVFALLAAVAVAAFAAAEPGGGDDPRNHPPDDPTARPDARISPRPRPGARHDAR